MSTSSESLLSKAGPSEPGQPSRPKEARARFVPPKIDRKNLKDLTVSAGSMVKPDANVVGEPSAVVTWKFESVELESSADKSMTITNLPYNTKLVLLSTSGLLTDLILQRTFKP